MHTLAKTPLTWLASLKISHLKTIARATGTLNAGRKDVLCERIGSEIEKSVFLCSPNTSSSKKHETTTTTGEMMSILSIDMGIQNLAFAHLLVRPAGKEKMEVVLDAWHRIGVQELSLTNNNNNNNNNIGDEGLPPSAFRTLTRKAAAQRKKTTQEESQNESRDERNTETQNETQVESQNETENAETSFSPDILANNAYTLLSRLIAQYNPTHILIERQRFRSGGQTAVLEWSLRVGMFEGMLHAVLCTMRRLGHCAARVWDVSPARVAQYWEATSSSSSGSDMGPEKQTTTATANKSEKNQRNIKKMKINIIGQWLSHASSSSSSASPLAEEEAGPAKIILPSENGSDVHDTVTAYLERWSGKRSSATQWRIEKLDDLADCLLQGMTWLEWQVRRAHLARDGLEELARMGVSVKAQEEKKKSTSKKKR
jgi:cruciform cutting endonuclease 1